MTCSHHTPPPKTGSPGPLRPVPRQLKGVLGRSAEKRKLAKQGKFNILFRKSHFNSFNFNCWKCLACLFLFAVQILIGTVSLVLWNLFLSWCFSFWILAILISSLFVFEIPSSFVEEMSFYPQSGSSKLPKDFICHRKNIYLSINPWWPLVFWNIPPFCYKKALLGGACLLLIRCVYRDKMNVG